MTEERLALGSWGEDRAVAYLKRCGLTILERNFRTPVGEVDIIARYGKVLVFAEVKTRRSARFGSPLEAVGPVKQRQIIRAAQWYLTRHGGKLQPRFDVIAVVPGAGDSAAIEHVPNAFGIDG